MSSAATSSQLTVRPVPAHLVQRRGRDNLNSCDLTVSAMAGGDPHGRSLAAAKEKEKWQRNRFWKCIMLSLDP